MSMKHVGVMLVTLLLIASCGSSTSAPDAGAPAASTPAPAAAADQATTVVPPTKNNAAAISAWAAASDVEEYRAKNIETAAKELGYASEAIADSSGWGDYKKKFLLAADSGQAPDIVLSGHEDIAPWAQSGYIVPLDDMIAANPDTYNNIFPSLWQSVTWNGKRWGIPQDTEARPMFYNKKKLAELGWSQQEIDSLPDRIKTGEFTLDDMITTAQQAIDKGVVKPENGYWHRPSKGNDFYQYYLAYNGQLANESGDTLVFDKQAAEKWFDFQHRVVETGITPKNIIGTDWKIWHETVTSGDVLFWNGGIWQFADWAKNYVQDKGGEDYLYGFVGWALQPSGITGQPGVTLSHPLVYMVTASKASGEEQQQEAFKTITAATTPELNDLHALSSTHLAVLKTQLDQPDYAANKLLQGTAYMLDYTHFLPNNPNFGAYDEIVFRAMSAAESGEMSPQDAVARAADELQTELGDKVIIR